MGFALTHCTTPCSFGISTVDVSAVPREDRPRPVLPVLGVLAAMFDALLSNSAVTFLAQGDEVVN
jgi:hypothetical protein